ncbi:MAG: MBL fold metallo-hydrolase [Candidatus Eisenbacteria bacterium]|nr:MBL fold metallo-hydrolase [Candidatus Eisenbacteria bacterium]
MNARLTGRSALLAALLLAFACAPGARAADDHHDRAPSDPFRLQPLRGGVHALYGRGGNVGFYVGPRSVLLIDDQFKDLAPGIKAQVEKVTPLPIRFLVNTHHHGDHVGGNEFFSQFAEVLAHENVRTHMLASPAEILAAGPRVSDSLKALAAATTDSAKRASLNSTTQRVDDQVMWAKTVKIEEIAPLVTLAGTGEMRVHLGDETIRLVHYDSAHTDGDCVVFFEKAHVIHMGDVYFHAVIPYIDWQHGASVPGYMNFIDSVLAHAPDDAMFIPGHGEVSDAAGLREFRAYLADLSVATRGAHDAGKTMAQAVESVKLPKYEKWSGYKERLGANVEAAWRTIYR